MKRISKQWFKDRSRAQIMAAILGLTMIMGALCWGAESVSAQWRPRKLARIANSFQRGLQQPPGRIPPKQIKKLDPNPVRGGGPGKNPNAQRPANLRNEFSDDELKLVPRGIVQPAPLLYVFRQLNLSGEQRVKLRNLAIQTGNEIPVLRNLQRAQNMALDEALYSRNFDPKLVEQRASELANTQAEIIKVQARIMAQIRQILTTDQAVRFRELLDEERNRQNQPPLPAPTPIR